MEQIANLSTGNCRQGSSPCLSAKKITNMNLVKYWKKRCELAEAYIEESPCDPDIYKEQLDAWNNWCEFKKLPIPVVILQNKHEQ